MAEKGGEEKAPIIIKKVKKGGDAAHGGAWKVAYADFVTAMMAFFLLLWLLAVTTSEQKLGLSDYFSPASPSRQQSGAGGVLGGKTITVNGAAINSSSPPALRVPIPSPPQPNNPEEDQKDGAASANQTGAEGMGSGPRDGENNGGGTRDMDRNGDGQVDEQELKAALAQHEEQQFAQMEQDLRQAIQQVPELKDLQHNVIMQRTQQGERLSLVDQEGYSMFPSGSARMNPQTAQLLSMVAQAVAKLPNKVSITGHTDATPYNSNGSTSPGYGNWELSTDRANASRRALEASGVAPGRIESVVGRADNDPLFPEDPKSPRNRRISIVVLRENPLETPAKPTPVGPAPATGGPSISQPPHP